MEIGARMDDVKVNVTPFWLDLLAIVAAELLTVFFHLMAGIICHGALLIIFIVQSVLAQDKRQRYLFMALCLVPLIRILSLSMPLAPVPQIYWYVMIYTPLAAATIVVMLNSRLSAADVGLVTKGLFPQIILGIVAGAGLGVLEYLILRPVPLAAAFTFNDIWLPALVLVITTGFVEELIFRGVLQNLSEKVMGMGAVLYVSLVFAVLHMGFYSVLDVGFVFVVALVFTMIVKKTGSLVGVMLAHGVANAVLYMVMPFILA